MRTRLNESGGWTALCRQDFSPTVTSLIFTVALVTEKTSGVTTHTGAQPSGIHAPASMRKHQVSENRTSIVLSFSLAYLEIVVFAPSHRRLA
jgi:hypothetical protein